MGAFVAPIIAGLSALGGIFGNKKSTSSSTTTTTPNFTPQEQSLINLLNSSYTSQIQGAPAWNKVYETGGLQNLVNSATQTSQAANDALAARGISRTTAGANTLTNTSYQQGQQLSNFLNNAPVVEQANLSSLLSGASGFEASLPVGSTSNSSGTAINGPVNFANGGISGGAQGLAAILGQQSATNSLGNILKGLGIQTGTLNGLGNPITPTYAPGSTLTNLGASGVPTDNYSDTDQDWGG